MTKIEKIIVWLIVFALAAIAVILVVNWLYVPALVPAEQTAPVQTQVVPTSTPPFPQVPTNAPGKG